MVMRGGYGPKGTGARGEMGARETARPRQHQKSAFLSSSATAGFDKHMGIHVRHALHENSRYDGNEAEGVGLHSMS